jgi:hypothetical protein
MTVPKYDPKTALDTAMAGANKYMIDKYYEQLIENVKKFSLNNNNNQTGIIEVYFESKGWAEVVATFIDEETYIKCLPALELLAKENNCTITESIK